ncbi:hypothetical protein X975_14818, partial [Stegodyphus mimosarum]
MGVSVYLIIVIVFVILSFGIWSCIIAYCIYQKCNPKSNRRQSNHVDESRGRRYLAFDIQDDLSRVSERPFSITERMEVPPPYEEAIKHNAFRGYSLYTANDVLDETQRPNSNESSNFLEILPQNPVSPTCNQPGSPQNVLASTSGCSSHQARSGADSSCASNPLTTISEEFDEYDA